MIKVATFNLKHGAGAEGYVGNPKATAEACASLKADVLALQEVDKRVVRSRCANLAGLVAKASGMNVVFAPTMKFHIGRYGNALLVNGEIEDVEVLDLGGGPRFRKHVAGHEFQRSYEPRNAILATARIGDRQYSVASTHLSTDHLTNSEQLTIVLDALACRPEPHILLGDLNQNRRQVLAQPLLNTMELADGPPTFKSPSPNRNIDHIAVSGLTICAVEARLLAISDHLALVATLE